MIINNNSITNQYVNVYSFNGKTTYLPIFQRGFAWKAEQTEKILENIDTLLNDNSFSDKQLYLLDFIGFDEDGNFKLADGQQRFITLTILTKCVREYMLEHNMTPTIQEFAVEYDDMDCQKLWSDFSSGKIIAPYKKVYLRLNQYVQEHGADVRNIELILMQNIYIYIKMTETADDAFDIFEQINTGGKPLTKDEIIRTIIRQYSNKYGVDLKIDAKELKNVLTSYCKYCGSIEGSFNNLAIMSFLDKQVVKDKASFMQFEQYIRTAEKVKDLPIMYVAKLLNRTQLIDIIYAYESNGINLKTTRKPIDEVLLPLFLLCAIFSLMGTNPSGRVKNFLDSIVDMVRTNEPSKNITQAILDFADKNKDICNINLGEFENILKGKTKQNILKAILLMDVIKSNTSGSFTPELINLEHIYPQTPDIEWSRQGYPVNIDDQEELIHDIGNYLILNEAINKKIQNEYITIKRVEYDRIIPNDQFLQTRSNTVDFDKFEHDGRKYIAERRIAIARYIWSDFPCSKAFIK